jgi:hypothetical protein
VDVHELAPGLRYWFAPHPAWRSDENWPEGVLCAYYEAPDALVLFDPLVPRGEEHEFWQGLDRDVERLGRPVRVLLTAPWHDRDTALVVDMFSGTDGRFHVFVSPDEPNPEAFLASLSALLELPIERVLIAHGDPVLSNGLTEIRKALESA